MSLSIQKIIILSILSIYTLYAQDIKKETKKQPFLYDCKYNVYNDADIQLAKSSHASWHKGKEYGYFTAIAYRDGLEHGCSLIRVLITKIDESNSVSDSRIIKDIQIGTPAISGYIKDISLEVINNKLSLGIDISKRVEPNLIVKQILMIDLDGNVTELVPFKSAGPISETFYK